MSVSVALVIQHAKGMHRIMLSPAALWIHHILPCYKRHDFREKVIEHKIIFFSTNFVWKNSHYNTNSTRYHHRCSQELMPCTRYLCQILINFEFSRQIFERNSNFIKSSQREQSCSMRTDGVREEKSDRDERDKANSLFSQFCERG
jgi:hypothetical protein